MPKGVLFDLDGTLLDSAPDFIASLDNLLSRYNQPKLDPEIIRSHVSDGSWKLTSLGFNIDTSDDRCASLREELLDEYEANLLKHGGAFDGIREMLTSLGQDNIPYGIVTNKLSLYAKPIVNHFTIFKDSQILVCPDDVKISKPDPEGILLACRKLKVNPKNTVYLGDHPNDLKAAHSAGANFIGCLYGYSLGEDISDLSVKLPKEIIQKIS